MSDLPLAAVRYFARVGSTNDLAARWAEAGGPHLGLVLADEQTTGRGRASRRWYTPPGCALAFSLILHGQALGLPQAAVPQLTALGALAVCDALNQDFTAQTTAQIKWPNDVIAGRRKLAGALAEAHWQGLELQAVILGVGINVAPESLPAAELLDFPATCLEAVLGRAVDRWSVLHAVLDRLLAWLPSLGQPGFIQAWEQRLAFCGEWVQVRLAAGSAVEGRLLGLAQDGSLILQTPLGEALTQQIGEVHLRPVDRL